MNTWSDKKSGFFQSNQYLQTQFQMSAAPTHGSSFKKLRNLSNEENKMQRHVSDLQQVQQSHFNDFSQNQISDQN